MQHAACLQLLQSYKIIQPENTRPFGMFTKKKSEFNFCFSFSFIFVYYYFLFKEKNVMQNGIIQEKSTQRIISIAAVENRPPYENQNTSFSIRFDFKFCNFVKATTN